MTDLDETYTPTYETPNGLPNGLPEKLDNRCTLTYERTNINELTNSYQDQGLNRSVPNAPTPVDNHESGRPEMVKPGRPQRRNGAGAVTVIKNTQLVPGIVVEIRMPYRHPRVGRIVRVSRYVYVSMWSPRLGRFAYGTVSYHRDFVHQMPDCSPVPWAVSS